MNSKWSGTRPIRLSLGLFGALVMLLFLVSWGRKTHAQNHTPVHMTTDWSNRHMVYSAPSSTPQAWRLQAEPRYLHQLARRKAPDLQAQSAQ